MQDMLEVIHSRHSTRVPFDPGRQIASQDLRQILEAGRWAPTAHNMQNFDIMVVDDEKVLKELGSIKRTVSEVFIRESFEQLSFPRRSCFARKSESSGPTSRLPGGHRASSRL